VKMQTYIVKKLGRKGLKLIPMYFNVI